MHQRTYCQGQVGRGWPELARVGQSWPELDKAISFGIKMKKYCFEKKSIPLILCLDIPAGQFVG